MKTRTRIYFGTSWARNRRIENRALLEKDGTTGTLAVVLQQIEARSTINHLLTGTVLEGQGWHLDQGVGGWYDEEKGKSIYEYDGVLEFVHNKDDNTVTRVLEVLLPFLEKKGEKEVLMTQEEIHSISLPTGLVSL